MNANEPITPSEGKLIRSLLRRVPEDSQVRAIVEWILHGGETPRRVTAPLLAALADETPKHWRIRLLSAWALGRVHIPDRVQAEASAALSRILRQPRSVSAAIRQGCSFWLVVWFWTNGFLGIGVLLIALAAGSGFELATRFMSGCCVLGWILCVLASPFAIPLYITVSGSRFDRIREAAAHSLGQLADPHSAGALSAAVRDQSTQVSIAAAESLRKVLPLLTPEHYGQLPADTVPNLCGVLDRVDEEMDLAVLEALEKVGDGRAVSTVEHLANSIRFDQVREAAVRLLPILLERQRREKDAAILLRPSSASPSDTLLRPATGTTQSDPQQLLRPVNLKTPDE